MDLLLDEDDYQKSINILFTFAEQNKIECEGSQDLVKIAITMMLSVNLTTEDIIFINKLVYNIGYRDNEFVNLFVH